MRRVRISAALVLAALVTGCHQAPRSLRLATTTSVDSSGLLDTLLPAFSKQTGIRVEAVAVGSGKALQLARRGDADLTLTHDPDIEAAFVAEQRALTYRKVMFNDFLIAGPADDPARVSQAANAVEAMRRIAVSPAPFVSRGDSSGTEAREKLLWSRAGATPPRARLLETGQAMAPTLRVASERAAYCLTDRATFVQLQGLLALRALFEGGPELLNTYAVMVVRGRGRDVEASATRFVQWLTDGEGRSLIAGFTVKGAAAYSVWPAGAPRDAPGDLPRQDR